MIRKTGNANIFRLPCFYLALKQYTYRTYNSLMEVELAIEKFEQDTMPKFSVYQRDKTFGAKGIISLSLFRTIQIFFFCAIYELEAIVLLCHEISVFS